MDSAGAALEAFSRTAESVTGAGAVVNSGRGRKTQSDVELADDAKYGELKVHYDQAVMISDMPDTSEAALMQYCKQKVTKLNDIAAQISSAIKAMKRRKTTSEIHAQRLDDMSTTMAVFLGIFVELSSTTTNALQLDAKLTLASDAGITFNRLVQAKRCKSLCLDAVRFNDYPELARLLSEGGFVQESCAGLSDGGLVQFIVLILEQVMQKMIRALPSTVTHSACH